jgi:ribosome-interacting GTPase 1
MFFHERTLSIHQQVGIRLNQKRPNLNVVQKAIGGIKFNATVPLTHLNEGLVKTILHEYRIHNAEILVREDATVDQFLDVVEGNRIYMRCLYVYNKIDTITIEEVDRIAHQEDSVVLSCTSALNIEFVKEMIWVRHLVSVFLEQSAKAPGAADWAKRKYTDFFSIRFSHNY